MREFSNTDAVFMFTMPRVCGCSNSKLYDFNDRVDTRKRTEIDCYNCPIRQVKTQSRPLKKITRFSYKYFCSFLFLVFNSAFVSVLIGREFIFSFFLVVDRHFTFLCLVIRHFPELKRLISVPSRNTMDIFFKFFFQITIILNKVIEHPVQ